MTNLYASHLQRLVELKQEEANLKIQIASFQQLAIEEALTIGKTGTIAIINGAKIIFKLMPVKPKPTEEIFYLQKNLAEKVDRLAKVHSSRIDNIDCAIRDLSKEKALLLENEETLIVQFEIDQKFSLLKGEMTPQISVTLPKS